MTAGATHTTLADLDIGDGAAPERAQAAVRGRSVTWNASKGASAAEAQTCPAGIDLTSDPSTNVAL